VPFHSSGSSDTSEGVAAVMRTPLKPACGERFPRVVAMVDSLKYTRGGSTHASPQARDSAQG